MLIPSHLGQVGGPIFNQTMPIQITKKAQLTVLMHLFLRCIAHVLESSNVQEEVKMCVLSAFFVVFLGSWVLLGLFFFFCYFSAQAALHGLFQE